MEISIKWFDGAYPSFNVALASKAGNEPFLEIKSCRIVSGKDGDFVSPPSTKNAKTDKYWNHAYFSKDFAAVVLEKAKESQPKQQQSKPQEKQSSPDRGMDNFSDDIPFANPTKFSWRSI